MDTAVKLHGCRKIVFSGGEPFLRRDLFEIIDMVSVPVIILTNGTIPLRKFMPALLDFNRRNKIYEVRITYDGNIGQRMVRDKATADIVFQNIEHMIDEGIPLAVNTMVTQLNLDDLTSLYKAIVLDRRLTWLVDFPFRHGRWKRTHKAYEVIEIDRMFDIFQSIVLDYVCNNRYFKFGDIEIANYFSSNILQHGFYFTERDEHPCSYSYGAMTIKPNGDIGFCPTLNWVFGNVNVIPISSIPLDSLYQKWISMRIEDVAECAGCRFLQICGTGCRADAYYQSGTYLSRDENACLFISNFHNRILPVLSKELQYSFREHIYQKGWHPLE